jgi:hypothetical protein
MLPFEAIGVLGILCCFFMYGTFRATREENCTSQGQGQACRHGHGPGDSDATPLVNPVSSQLNEGCVHNSQTLL